MKEQVFSRKNESELLEHAVDSAYQVCPSRRNTRRNFTRTEDAAIKPQNFSDFHISTASVRVEGYITVQNYAKCLKYTGCVNKNSSPGFVVFPGTRPTWKFKAKCY